MNTLVSQSSVVKRLNEQQYVAEHRYLFRRLHQHDDVWWTQPSLGYAKPAFQFRAIVPGAARPSRIHAPLAYRHLVPDVAMGNQVVNYMVLEGDDLRGFALNRLDSKTRNLVRTGLKRCEVMEMSELEPYLEDAREACISHSKRLAGSRQSYHVSHTYFIEQADSWRAQMRRDFISCARTWWGAFWDKRLLGYMVMLQVEDVVIVEKLKVHTDAVSRHVSDVLYYTALEHAGANETCRRILNSPPQREGLDRFKMRYLFKPTPLGFFISNLPLYRVAMGVAGIRESFYRRFRAGQSSSKAQGAAGGLPAQPTASGTAPGLAANGSGSQGTR